MFTFGFSNDDPDLKDNRNQSGSEPHKQLDWAPCVEVPSPGDPCKVDSKDVRIFTCGDCILSHVSPDKATQVILRDVKELEHSDLLPAKYEGGLKVWECTRDLIEFLQLPTSDIDFSDQTVLDLGCGAGLVGVFALQRGACVHFQDYNEAVITSLTMPNVALNTTEDNQTLSRTCRYFYGDWESFPDLVDEHAYDYIFTSETIYNPDNHVKICSVIKKTLKKTGVAFLAAKTYYFGVGGSIHQFEETLRKDDTLKCSVVWKHTQGVQREILRITFKNVDG